MEQVSNKKTIIIISVIAVIAIAIFIVFKLLSKDNTVKENTSNIDNSNETIQENSNKLKSTFSITSSSDKKVIEKVNVNGLSKITVPEGKMLIVFEKNEIIDVKNSLKTSDVTKSNDYYYVSILEYPMTVTSKMKFDNKEYNCLINFSIKISDPVSFFKENGKKEISSNEVYLNTYNNYFENNIYNIINDYFDNNKQIKEKLLKMVDNNENNNDFTENNPTIKFRNEIESLLLSDLDKISLEKGVSIHYPSILIEK